MAEVMAGAFRSAMPVTPRSLMSHTSARAMGLGPGYASDAVLPTDRPILDG